ncbi:MAG: OadG family protein, partial [Clostridia bacterium]|nr:OadG family protein [Clostridia bacterium]
MFLFQLATETAGEILSDAGLTIVIGFVVVFAVLLLLTGVFKGFGVVMSGTKNEKEVPAAPVAPVAA